MFLTLQSVLESSISVDGGDNFKIQHGRKQNLTSFEKQNYNLTCNENIYENAVQKYEESF